MSELRNAQELAREARKGFPGESAEYKKARTELLAEEIELRRKIESVAAQRRKLPRGPEAKDYKFIDEQGETISLEDLFGRHSSLYTYIWMFGPDRKEPCPMCTAFVGSFDQPVRDIEQRMAVAIIGRSPVSRQMAFARERGWSHLKFYQCVGDEFARDFGALAPNGEEWPAMVVWRKGSNQKPTLFWAAEFMGTADPGQDPRLAPDPTPLWNMLDLSPEGRSADWYPKVNYEG
jgi:predicted dithiol-disulfide oxidoreductase (DUF899 family)